MISFPSSHNLLPSFFTTRLGLDLSLIHIFGIWDGKPGEKESRLLITAVYQKASIWNTYQAVSYTHLDVYKRQCQCSSIHHYDKKRCPACHAVVGGDSEIVVGFGRKSKMAKGFLKHRDVYKRQTGSRRMMYFSRMRPERCFPEAVL